MSTHGRTAPTSPVLTSAGRAWLQARLERSRERLERVEGELATERDEELLEERRQLTTQITELEELLADAVAPGELTDDPTIVEIGDEVEIEYPDGSRESFLVVHPVEAGLDEHRTSAESPLARAVLGHRPGDRVTVRTPVREFDCNIIRRERID